MEDFVIRPAEEKDYEKILEIYAIARDFMRAHGNPRQWNTAWPPADLVREDIRVKRSYVCTLKDEVVGVFVYIEGIDPTYLKIDGAWLDDSLYGVVHRVATLPEVHGAGRCCLNWAYERIHHLRIDTHGDNMVMQAFLPKLGFVKTGIIYVVEDNDPRIAYEKSELTEKLSRENAGN